VATVLGRLQLPGAHADGLREHGVDVIDVPIKILRTPAPAIRNRRRTSSPRGESDHREFPVGLALVPPIAGLGGGDAAPPPRGRGHAGRCGSCGRSCAAGPTVTAARANRAGALRDCLRAGSVSLAPSSQSIRLRLLLPIWLSAMGWVLGPGAFNIGAPLFSQARTRFPAARRCPPGSALPGSFSATARLRRRRR
jgi:hypothetical protein